MSRSSDNNSFQGSNKMPNDEDSFFSCAFLLYPSVNTKHLEKRKKRTEQKKITTNYKQNKTNKKNFEFGIACIPFKFQISQSIIIKKTKTKQKTKKGKWKKKKIKYM